MGMVGKRKFICCDCGGGTFFTPKERKSRFRIRCKHCGSIALDPAGKSKVKSEILKINENRLLPQTGSILRAGHKILGDE